MPRGWLRVMVRYPLVVLVEQGRLSQEEAAREMGLSTRQVRRVLKRYRESGQRLESLAYQRRHSAWNALPRSTKEEIQRLQREYPRWSAPAIAEVLAATEGVVVHRATVHRLLRRETGNSLPRHRRPALRFEMRAFGELWQMDTSVGAWLEGYRRVCVVAILDDYSRAAVAARGLLLRLQLPQPAHPPPGLERYGRPRVLYTENDSKFRLTRYQCGRFFTHWEETLQGLVETEVGRVLRELDVQLLSHLPGNAQAKGISRDSRGVKPPTTAGFRRGPARWPSIYSRSGATMRYPAVGEPPPKADGVAPPPVYPGHPVRRVLIEGTSRQHGIPRAAQLMSHSHDGDLPVATPGDPMEHLSKVGVGPNCHPGCLHQQPTYVAAPFLGDVASALLGA